jgi:hypothetical protein
METFTMSRKEVPRPGLLRHCVAGRITNAQAAQALHLSVRQVQRLKGRLVRDGVRGLIHRLRGRPSNRRLAAAVGEEVGRLMTTTYLGFNDSHLTEKLQQVHGLVVSRASVHRLRRALGRPAQRPRRPPLHRARRPRADAVGRLVQVDGSPCAWLEDRGPALTLLGAIDDASSAILALHFRPAEDLHGYFVVLQQLLRQHGVPVALYGDRLNVFVRNDRHWTLDEELAGAQAPTHFGRVLGDLGVAYIAAQSPQGKGRIERLWGTLQDRLVSELRLRRIATREAANAFLPEFIAAHNRRFATSPAILPSAWRPVPRQLERLLSCRYTRVVARDNTVRLGTRWIQLPPGPAARSWAGRRVEVRELLDGRLLVSADTRLIATAPAPPQFELQPRPRASHAPRGRRPSAIAPRWPSPAPTSRPRRAGPRRPAADHPWCVSIRRHLARKAALARRGDISTEQSG